MKKCILIYLAVVLASYSIAKDLSIEEIPTVRIKQVLPKEWYIESVCTVDTVAGWKKLSEASGIRIVISRTPYDDKLHKTKSGGLSVHIPRFYLYVFPEDFVGRHVNGARTFKNGKVVTDKSPLANHATLVMEAFTSVGRWYVFHNKPTFKDWKTPVNDVISKMKEVLSE